MMSSVWCLPLLILSFLTSSTHAGNSYDQYGFDASTLPGAYSTYENMCFDKPPMFWPIAVCSPLDCDKPRSFTIKNKICFCDSLCHVKGDCCSNYYLNCNATLKPPVYRCMPPFRHKLSGKRYYAICTCHESYHNTLLEEECLNNNASSVRHNLLVTGVDMLVYRNEYCARCNRRAIASYFTVKTRCHDDKPCYGTIIPDASTLSLLGRLLDDARVSMELEAPPGTEKRNCSIVDSCPEHSLDSAKCLHYAAFAMKNQTVFKNGHCARCNAVFLNESVTCNPFLTQRMLNVPPLTSLMNFGSPTNGQRCQLVLDGALTRCTSQRFTNGVNAAVESKDAKEMQREQLGDLGKCAVASTLPINGSILNLLAPANQRLTISGYKKQSFPMYFLVNITWRTNTSGLEKMYLDQNVGNWSRCSNFLKIESEQFDHQTNASNGTASSLPDYDCIAYNNFSYHCLKTRHGIPVRQGCSRYIPVAKDSYQLKDDALVEVKVHGQVTAHDQYLIIGEVLYLCEDFLPAVGGPQALAEQYLTAVCLLLSVLALSFLLMTYLMFAELRTLPGCYLMALASVMIVSQVTYLTGTGGVHAPTLCTAVAIILHYSLLSSFCWMGAMTADAGRTFQKRGLPGSGDSKMKMFFYSSLLGFGIPVLIVLICVLIDQRYQTIGYGTGDICWISNHNSLLIVFGLPVLLIIQHNFFVLIKIIVSLRAAYKISQRVNATMSSFHQAKTYLKLSTIMGLTWILGYASGFHPTSFLRWPFIVLNGLQGVFICISFVLTNQTVWKNFKQLFGISTIQRKVQDTKLKHESDPGPDIQPL